VQQDDQWVCAVQVLLVGVGCLGGPRHCLLSGGGPELSRSARRNSRAASTLVPVSVAASTLLLVQNPS
jgi:hypothetical protein